MSLFYDIVFFSATRRRYKRDYELRQAIMADPELAPKSKKMGVKSIVYSVISMVIVALGALGILLLFNMGDSGVFFAIIGSILIAAVLVITVIELYIRSLRFLVWQFKLNKHPIRWVGLAFIIIPSLLFVAAIIFIALTIINQ